MIFFSYFLRVITLEHYIARLVFCPFTNQMITRIAYPRLNELLPEEFTIITITGNHVTDQSHISVNSNTMVESDFKSWHEIIFKLISLLVFKNPYICTCLILLWMICLLKRINFSAMNIYISTRSFINPSFELSIPGLY